ncbi:DUF3516 domain-containing protein [Epidermidibacterium keratini]|uniref:DUF3516 domain-containing protein n=1 Tax=Epidermidibacterium keratini TaxID=1891644 RepID=A0A7L4YT70_9ACTN|nr:DUF3516 domain-containing protein [Epidermidibacterium keratini]
MDFLPARSEQASAAGDASVDPDAVYAAFGEWTQQSGLAPYSHQDEAILELLSGNNVVLATPTGSGKSLVAVAALAAAYSDGRTAYYTAPIKALVNEKFFELVQAFGAANVGMITGDGAINAEAPIICCTAEVLANHALRLGRDAGVGMVVMDEFHYYADPQRGWAWQVPLLELADTQFLLMSATLGDMSSIIEDLSRRTGRDTVLVDDAERPVPLEFSWSLMPLDDKLDELVTGDKAPVYVVHPTQAGAIAHATALQRNPTIANRARQTGRAEQIAERLAGFRFGAGFGRVLGPLLRRGIGVHHAGMLPRYRRVVEQLAQAGLLTVVCGTDTLGVGVNVPIRTVLFTSLAKFDGRRQRVLRAREFHQIAGRAGRAGFDTIGYVVVQAPEHVIENARLLAKAGDDPKKRRKVQRRKPAEGEVVWTEQTFEKLVSGEPEPLASRMKVDNAMLVNVAARHEDTFAALRRLLTDNHEDHRSQVRLAHRALRLARSLRRSGVLTRLDEPDEYGRRFVLTVDLPPDFALNQPLSHFALAALDVLDPESTTYSLDVLSVIEAVLEQPRQVLLAQQNVARGEAIAAMKAEGIEYDERMERIESITWPQPLAELLEPLFETYRQTHPWLSPDALTPKSVVRQMWEDGMSFTDLIARYQLSRSEGLVLRYLSDAYRTLRQTLPETHRSPEVDDIIEWLGETIRQTDSSLLDEWDALAHPDDVPTDVATHAPPPPPRPLSKQTRPFEIMIANAMFARVQAISRDDVGALVRIETETAQLTDPPREVVVDRSAWDAALDAYYDEYDDVLIDADARSRNLLAIGAEETGEPVGTDGEITARIRAVRQSLHDPEANHDWVIDAVVDCDASDETGSLVLAATRFHRL